MGAYGAAIGAVVGGGLGLFGAIQNNQNVKGAYGRNISALDKQFTQQRLAAYDKTFILGQNASSQVGQMYNNASGTTGNAMSQVIAQLYADRNKDQSASNDALSQNLDNLQSQKVNLQAQANGQLKSPLIETFNGALSGASAGAGLGGSFASFNRQNDINTAFNDPNLTPAQAQALIAGVPPSALNNPAVTSLYQAQQQNLDYNNQLAGQGLISAQQNRGYSSFLLGLTRTRTGYNPNYSITGIR